MAVMARTRTPQPGDEAPEPRKSRRKGRPINVWVADELGATIDAYIAAQKVPPDVSAIVRTALEEFFEREGFWPPSQQGGE